MYAVGVWHQRSRGEGGGVRVRGLWLTRCAAPLYMLCVTMQTGLSRSPSAKIFPYTMDYGLGQACAFGAGSDCDTEQWFFPGLWEMPMYAAVLRRPRKRRT